MADGVVIDCATGESVWYQLSAADAQDLARAGAAADATARQRDLEQAWRAQQGSALAGVSAALHDATARGDAAALAGLVRKLVADPPQPLSAPEMSVLTRFMLRALLP